MANAAKTQYNVVDCKSPVVDVYGGEGAQALCTTIGPPTAATHSSQGTLPFSGADAGLMAGGALVLVALGVALRRAVA